MFDLVSPESREFT